MPRPANKEQLLEQGQRMHDALLAFIDDLPPDTREAEFPPGTLNRNIRDVLAHLGHWHGLMLDWYAVGMKGGRPDMPAKGYTWKATPELNQAIRDLHGKEPMPDVRKRFEASYRQVRKLIESHTDEELFEKKRYRWTGSTSLGAYLVSATSSHYDWALKLIRSVLR